MHATVPVRFGRGRLDSLGNKGLAAYLIRIPGAWAHQTRNHRIGQADAHDALNACADFQTARKCARDGTGKLVPWLC
jgi:hypothetical protein